MTDPRTALLIGTILLLCVIILFYPKSGVIARWRRTRSGFLRVLIEDALKHLFDCETRQIPCTIHSVAGALVISTDEASALIKRLESMGLLSSINNGIQLTIEGRRYALRIIRIHRLWERYLADQTSVPETEWHAAAEIQEHRLSDHEAEALAARIGNPPYDPHGDPIPLETGEIPPTKGISLQSLQSGQHARITHIEDEPETMFAQIVAEGLYVGMHLMIIEISNERIRFAADGEEIVLAPIFAGNITVEPIEEDIALVPRETLASLQPGEEATVSGISKACRGQQRRRLLDLGVVPGTRITAELRSAAGDPTAYQVRGALIALRKQHAQQIFIERT